VAAIADLHGAGVSPADNHPGLRVTLEFRALQTVDMKAGKVKAASPR
jgi:hypothetical protein